MAKKVMSTVAPVIHQDLTAKDPMEQIKALLLNLSPEQRKQLTKEMAPPKRDIGKLLAMKEQTQAFIAKLFLETLQETIDGQEGFGVLWKAAWPKKYYRLNMNGLRGTETWEPGGYANAKPDWITGKNGVEVSYELVRLVNGQEVVEDNGHDDTE